MDDMNPVYKDGYLSAPDDETYNAALKYISNGGLGWSCGECYEVVGAKGTIYVLVSPVSCFHFSSFFLSSIFLLCSPFYRTFLNLPL
jgi:hypothetical protein